jgi:hypothetical protein
MRPRSATSCASAKPPAASVVNDTKLRRPSPNDSAKMAQSVPPAAASSSSTGQLRSAGSARRRRSSTASPRYSMATGLSVKVALSANCWLRSCTDVPSPRRQLSRRENSSGCVVRRPQAMRHSGRPSAASRAASPSSSCSADSALRAGASSHAWVCS